MMKVMLAALLVIGCVDRNGNPTSGYILDPHGNPYPIDPDMISEVSRAIVNPLFPLHVPFQDSEAMTWRDGTGAVHQMAPILALLNTDNNVWIESRYMEAGSNQWRQIYQPFFQTKWNGMVVGPQVFDTHCNVVPINGISWTGLFEWDDTWNIYFTDTGIPSSSNTDGIYRPLGDGGTTGMSGNGGSGTRHGWGVRDSNGTSYVATKKTSNMVGGNGSHRCAMQGGPNGIGDIQLIQVDPMN